VIVLRNQAQFQPQAYVVAMAQRAAEAGALIHEHSRVLEIDTKAAARQDGLRQRDRPEIVMATHSPKGIHLVHTEMPVHREYALAFEWTAGRRPARAPSGGGRRAPVDPHAAGRRRHYLVCAGQEHKVGIHNATAGVIALENLARKFFGDRPVTPSLVRPELPRRGRPALHRPQPLRLLHRHRLSPPTA
jgi:glycine/D-amino acid oxidase-like deaminating enzyme